VPFAGREWLCNVGGAGVDELAIKRHTLLCVLFSCYCVDASRFPGVCADLGVLFCCLTLLPTDTLERGL